MSSETIKNNQMLLRGCILYEYTAGKQLFDAYKDFCKVMGEDTMEYLDFEFWFMRFSRGEFNLNYDRSFDIKYSRSLSDLPIELVAKVMETTTWKDVLSLRQVSPNFQHIVDDIKFHYKKLHFNINKYGASLSVDNVYDHYKTEITGSDEKYLDDVWAKSVKKAFHNLKILMTIPKIHFEEFEVNIPIKPECRDLYSTINSIMSSTDLAGRVLKTRRICLDCSKAPVWIQCVEPGTLEEIEFKHAYGLYDSEDRILETEQWKQAKTLITKKFIRIYPMQHFVHFVGIDIQFHGLSVDFFLELKSALLKSPNFEKCSIKWLDISRLGFQQFDAIEKDVGINNRKDQIDPNHHHYVIQQDNKTFEIKIGPTFAEIERTS